MGANCQMHAYDSVPIIYRNRVNNVCILFNGFPLKPIVKITENIVLYSSSV